MRTDQQTARLAMPSNCFVNNNLEAYRVSPVLNHVARTIAIAVVTAFLGLFCLSTQAFASKQVVDFIGDSEFGNLGGQFNDANGAEAVAVNFTGAGGVPAGTIYVTDGGSADSSVNRGNRVQRFQREDSGTPADTADDTYSFVSAWGAGVDGGGTNFEICTVAANCGGGAPIGGNGTLAGNGALNIPAGVAVDQDTGEVYVVDARWRRTPDNNFRINVYSATGNFLRSFGWGVVESGPDDNGTGYEVCKANIDICKAGLPGSGAGQLGVGGLGQIGETAPRGIAVSQPDGNADSGTVFVADTANKRVNTYNLDGSNPSVIGSGAIFAEGEGGVSAPTEIAVDSRGILYVSNGKNGYQVERYDTENANGGGVGFLAPIAAPVDEVQELTIRATSGQFRLTFGTDTTSDLDFDATAAEVEEALRALPSVGSPNLSVFGGPGNASGSDPYKITFGDSLRGQDVGQVALSTGTTPLNGGIGSSSITTTRQGHGGPLLYMRQTEGLTVDPDSDGPGPDSDVLYVLRSASLPQGGIQQFGPLNQPGLVTPPNAADDVHGTVFGIEYARTLAIEPPTGRLYLSGDYGRGVFVFDNEGPAPTAAMDQLSEITGRSVVAHATIDPNGPPNTSYHFEYSTDQINWVKEPTILLGHQEDPQAVKAEVGSVAGLHPNTHYYVRLVAGRRFTSPIVTAPLDFTTASAPPLVETTGSPLRTATTVQFSGRLLPSNASTQYHFEFGSGGPCSANPCASTEPQSAGSGDEFRPVATQVKGLEPDTTYHYRLIADNGDASGLAIGADMTVTTRLSDAPLSHGRFAGPAGSDRAYEQVSLRDTGGNPLFGTNALSVDGNRIFYRVSGGTPLSGEGSAFTPLYAERIETAPHQGSWRSSNVFPPREELVGNSWIEPAGRQDLADQIAQNIDTTSGRVAIWRLRPGQPAQKIYEPAVADFRGPVVVSENASRILTFLRGAQDPSHMPPNNAPNLYDISTGVPKLVSLLPDGSVSSCGAELTVSGGGAGAANIPRAPHWISADGSLIFYQICGDLYLRDLTAGESTLIALDARLIKSIPGVAFIATGQSLAPEDEGGADIYRYDLDEKVFECVTCVVEGIATNVNPTLGIAIAEDGSRVYFTSATALLPGASTPGIYRVNVASGGLAYVAPVALVSEDPAVGNALTPDGSALVFPSSDARLDQFGGQQNGGTVQYYRYDDRDRSLACLSCPQDGSDPAKAIEPSNMISYTDGAGANRTALSADGKTFAFATANALLPADQNTAPPGELPRVGADIYEWRDGRLFLITDGLTNWPDNGPTVNSVTPSGKDIFFTAAKQYTPDALDALRRLYTARIGGGFEFPPPPKPCPLEVCQGTPKGAPEEREPGSGNFAGPGNKAAVPPARRACAKGRHKVRRGSKTRCLKSRSKAQQKKRQRAKHDRRNSR